MDFDFQWLKRYLMMHKAEDQDFSYPFLVQLPSGRRVIAWFWFDVSGTSPESWFVHIHRIYTMTPDQTVHTADVVLDVPASPASGQPVMLREYLKSLEALNADFSAEKMDQLIQQQAGAYLYRAYCCVKRYITVKEKE